MKTVYALLLVFGALVLAVGCSTPSTDTAPISAAAAAAHDAATKAPTCAVSFTSPTAIDGSNFFGSGSLDDCSFSGWNGILEVRVAKGDFVFGVDIDRSQAAPGNTLMVGAEAVVFAHDYISCEGTVTWISDEPDWALSVDAVCHGATGDYVLAGSLHGHVYSGNN